MTNTAIAIQRAIAAGTSFDGVSLTGPVHVVCRSISARAETGFYLDELREQGVTVSQYANLAPQAGVRRGIVRRIEPLLEFLPPSVGEATRKLTDVLDTLSPQVAHIWQDGMIMATLLATLIARVPRIVLSLRTVPPIDRPERNLPDYHALYRTAADIPGVRLVANSHAAAKRFADWLAIAPDRIGVVHNGVEPPAPEGDSRARRAWEAFFAGAAPDAPVVGAVMRFDENKRPLQWVHAAQAILEHEPRARFVMIGDGPLRSSTQELAVRLGLADRILIPGNSRHVGFWLSKMSVLLLLSRHEGLPNALIEAQLAGVPVVATAAGGAAETFADRLTGTLLPGGEELDIELVVQAVRKWIVDPQTRGDIHRRCVDYAAPRFSMQSMIDATVRAYR